MDGGVGGEGGKWGGGGLSMFSIFHSLKPNHSSELFPFVCLFAS